MTFFTADIGSSAIARLPNTMTPGQEFLRLLALRKQIDGRLNVLVEALEGGPKPLTLPKSGLKQAAPGSLLFKGGRDAS